MSPTKHQWIRTYSVQRHRTAEILNERMKWNIEKVEHCWQMHLRGHSHKFCIKREIGFELLDEQGSSSA